MDLQEETVSDFDSFDEESIVVDNITKAISSVIKENLSSVFDRQLELNKILRKTNMYKKMYQHIVGLRIQLKNLKDDNEKLKQKIQSYNFN